MLSLEIACFVSLIFVLFGQEEPCVDGEIRCAMDEAGASYNAYYCYDDYLTTEVLPNATDPKSRSFAELKAACPNITSCSSTADLVWDLCGCPSCRCDQSTITLHETANFFYKKCTSCIQCTAFNNNGDKGWNCTDLYSVSNPYEWDHFTCDGLVYCTSNDPNNYATYSPGDTWWESISYDDTCETFCYCQYDGTTFCETSYENIVSSSHIPLQSAFFEECGAAIGCQNDPDLLSGSISSCGCPSCSCGSGKQSGDVEYVQYTEIDFPWSYDEYFPMVALQDDEYAYCMECICSDSTTRNCDQYILEYGDLYHGHRETKTCPPVSVTQCLTGEGTSTKPTDLTVSDCYGTQAFCGWSGQQITNSAGNVISNGGSFDWGCQSSDFCQMFNLNDGECFHIEMDFDILVSALHLCEKDTLIASLPVNAIDGWHSHEYHMCCSGTNCNDVEVDTASCADNSAMESYYVTYLQCLYGAEYHTHFCQERESFTCQDLEALGTWSIGCDCTAFSTLYALSSSTETQAIIAQELENEIAQMDKWSAAFECSLVFSCDLSSGQLSVNGVARPSSPPVVSTDAPSDNPPSEVIATEINPLIFTQTVALNSNDDSRGAKDLSSLWILWLAIVVVILLCIGYRYRYIHNNPRRKYIKQDAAEYQVQRTPTGTTPTGTAVQL